MERQTLAIVLVVVIVAAGVGLVVLGPTLFPQEPRVAIVFATGGLGDKSFNDAAYKGVMDFKRDYGWNFAYAEPTQIAEYEGFLRDFAAHEGRAPYDIIISIGFDQNEALYKVAGEYPNQKFAIVDMFNNRTSNVASLLFSEHEGSALVGAIAGLMTRTNKLGFIGGMNIPLINKFAAGYRFGANYTNNQTTVSIQYTGSWVDTAAGQALADGMYASGVDIIFAAAGRSGLGVFTSAKNLNGTPGYENPLWVIGVDSPQMYLGCADPNNPQPPTVGLTSMLKRVDVAVYSIIKDVYLNQFTGGIKVFNLANGGLDYEINTDLLTLPTSVIQAVEALKAAIIAGTVTVPDTL
ncbi:MAG: BMP family ABC transporter substrate-binding protein [Candidatus Thorarchaeota archaeon]